MDNYFTAHGTAPFDIPLQCVRGEDMTPLQIVFLDQDLTGWTAEAHVALSPGAPSEGGMFESISVSGDNSTLTILFSDQASASSGLPPSAEGEYEVELYWNVMLTSNTGVKDLFARGKFLLQDMIES